MDTCTEKKIGIIGGTGFIGGKIKEYGVFDGHELVLFSRGPGADQRLVPEEGKLDFSGLDAVINLAGEPVNGRWTEAEKKRIRASRIELTCRIVASLAAMSAEERPEVFLSASAVGFYGDRGEEKLTERAGAGSGFLAEVCVDWEEEAMKARDLGLRVVCLRTGVILGKGGAAWKQLRTVFRLGLGGRLGDGQQWMPWIHARDEVRALAHCLQNEISGPVNLAAPGIVRNAEFTREMARALHRPVFFPVPAFALKLALGDFADSLLGSARVQPGVLQKSGFEFTFPRLPAALTDLRD